MGRDGEMRSRREREGKERSRKREREKERERRGDRKQKHRRRRERSSSSSSSDEGKRADLPRAAAVVRELLTEFPAIAPDLLGLLQLLEDGETAVISGIANQRVRALLAELFPLLGLKKLRRPKGAYEARRQAGGSLLETVAKMLAPPQSEPSLNDSREPREKSEVQPRWEAPIGPSLPPPPPPPSAGAAAATQHDDDSDDEIVGPALPGTKGFRFADEQVEAEMARRAEELREEEWRRARGEGQSTAVSASHGGREAWMTQMPENNKLFQDAMGTAAIKRGSGKPAAFRSKEPSAVDSTWFDSPEERDRAKRAQLDMELLGYVRPENAPSRSAASDAQRANPGAAVNESILPSANPQADGDMRRQMEQLKQSRGPSLLEQHQKKVAQEQAKKANGQPERSSWNRDRDLVARRGISREDADRIIAASKQVSSKFTAPTVTRQFL